MLSSGSQRTALSDLPVLALRLSEVIVADLNRLGLRTVGQVRATPRAPLTRRFGGEVLRRLDQAMGDLDERLAFHHPREAIESHRSLLEPICTADALRTVIEALIGDVHAVLNDRGAGARLLDLHCDRVDGDTQAIRVGTSAPVDDATHLARLLGERIETIEPGFGIEAMRLTVVRAEPMLRTVQADALAGSAAVDNYVEARLVDRLRNRVGGDRVFRLAERPSQVPEQSQIRVPAGTPAETKSMKPAPASFRPPRLLDPPCPVAVPELDPAGAPAGFVWSGRHRRVRQIDDPERIDAEWWLGSAGNDVGRDYRIVEDPQGERFWLFRRIVVAELGAGDGGWFLHGLL